MREDEYNMIVRSVTSLLDDAGQTLIQEFPQAVEGLDNVRIISIIRAASKAGLIAGWIIGKMLLTVEDLISANTPGFEYDSLTQWFDDYEDHLPFKRSAAKVYKKIARTISFEQFVQLGYRKSNMLLVMKDEEKREALINMAIEKNMSSDEIRQEINTAIKDNLPEIEPSPESSNKQSSENMYQLCVQTWNPFKGCVYDCIYCKESFQRIEKRDFSGCKDCRDYKPHEHPEMLDPEYKLESTPFMSFIFICGSGDISFCSSDYLNRIVNRIRTEPDKNFLIQSKNPATFSRVRFPRNVILGTTLETNIDRNYDQVSKAPKPSRRYRDFSKIQHPLKMLTLEPMLEFDMDMMIDWVDNIAPIFVWIGTDSPKSAISKKKLEPDLIKIMRLQSELAARGHVVMLKDKLINRLPRNAP